MRCGTSRRNNTQNWLGVRDELRNYGRIYMYRLRPKHEMRAYPIEWYPAKCKQAASVMLMIQNNLDPAVAQHPRN